MSPSQLPSLARQTLLAPLDQRGRAAEVEQRLADAIRGGAFRDGEQLPSEAELAAQLGVATVTLREALVGLRRRGLVQTRRGRNGGTFVRAPEEEAEARLLAHLRELTVDDLRDLADHRVAVAATAAQLAAERASEADLARVDEHLGGLSRAATAAERRAADGRFHVELAAATRSLRLTQAEMQAQTEAGALVWLAAGADGAQRALAEHRAILDAVRERDAERARSLMAAHVAAELDAVVALHLRQIEPDAAPVLDRVCNVLEEVFDRLQELRRLVVALPAAPPREALAPIRDWAHALLADDEVVAGAGMVFAPGAVGDAPRWLEWWRRSRAGTVRFLDAALDPASPDFYDYERAEWYTTPRDTGERWVAGPFVDHSGTNEHILTLTLPVVRDGAFVGVAGADIGVGRVEAIAGAALAAIAPPAALVNHRGRVVATNAARWPVGTLWPGAVGGWPPTDESAVVQRDPRLPWCVVVER
ncbi:MAG TPA: FCD domain-containing protein [Capillimicrobium sp.]|nr:FCD domain-containing protein [Capillimicrobium sp.]